MSTCAAPIRHSPDQQPPEARTTSGTLPSPRKCCDTDLGLLDPGDDSSQPLISLLQRSRRPRGLVYWLRDQAVAHSMQQESLLDAQPFAVAHAQTKLDREPFTRPFAQGTALPDSASHSDQVRVLLLAKAARQWKTWLTLTSVSVECSASLVTQVRQCTKRVLLETALRCLQVILIGKR